RSRKPAEAAAATAPTLAELTAALAEFEAELVAMPERLAEAEAAGGEAGVLTVIAREGVLPAKIRAARPAAGETEGPEYEAMMRSEAPANTAAIAAFREAEDRYREAEVHLLATRQKAIDAEDRNRMRWDELWELQRRLTELKGDD